MEKLLIEFDEAGYNSELSTLEALGLQFTHLINQFNFVGIGELNTGDIDLLFSDPEKLMFQKMMKDTSDTIEGRPVNKEKLFEFLDKPASYYPYLEKLKKINASLQTLGQSEYTKIYKNRSLAKILGMFDFSDLTAISLKPETINQVKLLFEEYAVTEEAKASFEMATQLSEFFNKSDLFKKMGLSDKTRFAKLMECIDFVPGKGTQVNIIRVKNAKTNYGWYGWN